ncbi:AAA family ATPase [Pseudooceanicola sp. 502str34]
MKSPDPETLDDATPLLDWAALQGEFSPREALTATGTALIDPFKVAGLLSVLRAACTLRIEAGHELWLMRARPRRAQLAGMDRARLTGATPIEEALLGRGAFAPESVAREMAEGTDPAALDALVVPLARAGVLAPAAALLPGLRARLNALQGVARNDAQLASGFYGREAELRRMADWIKAPLEKPPARALHVSGLPGIGKSFLLEKVIQTARLELSPLLLRLDFDRGGLDILDQHAFFEEISRQLADALPDRAATLQDLRRQSAEEAAATRGRGATRSRPEALLRGMGAAVGDSGRLLLVVIDTLEVLRSRGETHVLTLFDHLDLMLRHGMQPMAVISAGRGDALDPAPDRRAHHLALRGLEEGAARALLRRTDLSPEATERVLALAGGNPLLLRLAATALERDSSLSLVPTPPGIAPGDDIAVAGYLYRAILSRVPDTLRQVANEGLILRRINAETLQEIVAPALGLDLSREGPEALLQELAAHHWLVDEAGGWLQHRADVRRAFLPLIYAERDRATAAINAAAAAWFAGHDPAEALYHRLQMTRDGAPLPDLPAEVVQGFTEDILEELPPATRDAVRQAMGLRSDFGRASAPPDLPADSFLDAAPPPEPPPERPDSATPAPPVAPPPPPQTCRETRFYRDPRSGRIRAAAPGTPLPPGAPDERAVRDLAMMLMDGAQREAGYILEKGFEGSFAADSPAGLTALTYLWLSGQWGAARRLLAALPETGIDRLLPPKDPEHLLTGRVLLEMLAEFRPAALQARLAAPDRLFPLLDLYVETQRQGLAGGALDLLLLTALPPDITPPSELMRSAGLISDHLAELPFGIDRDEARAMVESEARARVSGLAMDRGLPDDPAARAGLLMPLTPYRAALTELAITVESPTLADWLGQIGAVAGEIADRLRSPYAPDPSAFGSVGGTSPGEMVGRLNALGLDAEWSTGFALYHALPDLPVVAGAAERWRRSVAGLWSHGAAPAAWHGPAADHVSAARLARHLAAPRPEESARAALLLWDAPAAPPLHPSPELLRRHARRSRRALHRRAPEATPEAAGLAALAAFLKAGVPGDQAAALAALTASGTELSRIFPTIP